MFKTTDNKIVLAPDTVQSLLVQPVTTGSVASQVANVITTPSHTTRFPRLTADPTAAWTAEGEEIVPSDPTVDEVLVIPSKVAGLVVTTTEMTNDATTEAINEIGNGLVRQITNSIDAAFFGNESAPAPAGLGSITPTELTVATLDNLDWAEEARAKSAGLGATITTFVAHPDDALTLAKLKESTSSARGLLQPDPTAPTNRTVAGVPLLTSNHVTKGQIWGIPANAANLVIRDTAEVVADNSVFFTSDRVAIRATMRVGFGFVFEESIVRISVAP